MKRGAPMKRTGIARKGYWPGPRHISEVIEVALQEHGVDPKYLLARPLPLAPVHAVMKRAAQTLVQTPKHEYIRSPSLMKAYRELPCQHCGISDGTICGAHANLGLFGKGGRIKADDNRAASLCMVCHYELDQGHLWSYEQRRSIWVNAHAKTVNLLVLRGLWPAGVPVPETAELVKEWSLA